MHATLEVDLSAVAANYRLLKNHHAQKNIAAVVKANAYGLGVEEVSKTLWDEGCRKFFVATLEEGAQLRAVLPDAVIGVFSGLFKGEEKDYAQHRLTPVLNDMGALARMRDSGFRIQEIIIHIDTGMTRLGFNESELTSLPRILNPESRILLMSHLACASDADNPKNAEQLARFKVALALFPGARASLANSSGLFLPPEFHFDIGRPGCALYGIAPTSDNPMQHVATLSAPILQVRELDRDETVGYNGTYAALKGSRIAIVALGYADGYSRSLSNKSYAYFGDHKAPVVGRVSMDMTALDVSNIPESALKNRAEFINARQTVNDVATMAGTIGYEVFTRIGRRVKRSYSY